MAQNADLKESHELFYNGQNLIKDDLIAERDKYGANDVMPRLTGWAQINGRDELEIEEKAALDGEYVKKMSFLFDLKCFLGTISSLAKSEGVVEGGTGAMK